MSLPRRWLVFIYKVPAEPTRKRVYVWREMNRLGALYLQQAVCILPQEENLLTALQAVAEKIISFAGESFLLRDVTLEPPDEERVIQRFRQLRDEEYGEWIKEAKKYLAELQKEIRTQNFTHEEVEEEEAELVKLRQWLERIQQRDWFQAPRRPEALSLLEECENALGEFLEQTLQALQE